MIINTDFIRRIKWRNFVYFAQETFKSLKRNGFMTVASISTVTVSVLILGSFLLLFINSNHIASHLENSVQISVYMKNDTREDQINIIGSEIAALPGVTEIKTVSKEEAMERFKKRLGENAGILDALEDNPLPYSFDVHVDTPERITEIIPKIQGMRHVETARYGKEVVEQLFQFTKVLRYGGILLICLMALGTLFIIVNTIRLTVFARRREISIMKYVGATDWFIRWPFMLEGITIGVLGAVLSAVLLQIGYGAVITKIQSALAFLPIMGKWPLMIWLWLLLLFIGGGIGALGSYISLRKFLQV
ncbi:MAG: permease-like cell division protein FtsX [Acidaminococcaceae bacterium]|nr:permease-like cell division protein FtsX [Acidaminococcaceae bacterium]MDO4935898.1 permease-like cell division protein FtsX [Phascolarctobacterium sp.]